MAKAKGSRTVSFIVFAALVVCLVLAIIGLAIPQWTTIKINEDYADLVPDEAIEEALSGVSGEADAARVAAQIVSGIDFIGAG